MGERSDLETSESMTFDTEQLKKQLEQVDNLVKVGVISDERGNEWRETLIKKFEGLEGLKHESPPDIGNLPGKLVGAIIQALGAIARGSGATYEGLSKREGYLKGDRQEKKQKSPEELMNDIPEMYK